MLLIDTEDSDTFIHWVNTADYLVGQKHTLQARTNISPKVQS